MSNNEKDTTHYIDEFVFPMAEIHIGEYKKAAEKVAEIRKEHGAIAYFEFIGDDLSLEGTVPFTECITVKKDEVIIFGWVVFPSKEIRDLANKKVQADARISQIVTPLTNSEKLIFDAGRMVYGGFKPFIASI